MLFVVFLMFTNLLGSTHAHLILNDQANLDEFTYDTVYYADR